MTRTGYVWHEIYSWHDTGTYAGLVPAGLHVQPHQNFENPETKTRFAGLVEVSGLLSHLHRISAEPATLTDILRVHTPEHVARIKAESDDRGGDAGDGTSPFGPGSYEIALLAAGGTIEATRAVLDGEAENAYALVRPPGHHAVRDQGMGYCIFANIAVAIEWARANRGVQRIAVVDYDVHHGNGTQSIFEADPDVLTISLHQDRLFPPDAGMRHEQGIGEGFGSVINIPMPAGCGNGAYIDAIDRVVAPAVRAFAPELILVASGFDASAADPLGRMSVTAAGYRAIAERLVVLARDVCDGKLVVSHEGGYSAVYVPYCGLAVLEALSGVHTGVKDPFAEIWDSSPVHALTPWQDEAISASAKLAEALQLIVPAAATTRGAAPR